MQKHCLYLLLLLSFAACKKEDDPLFDKSPDERINETLSNYQQALTGAPYGWKALVFPSGVPKGVFSFYFRFNDSNRVAMFSDFDAASSATLKESSYRLKALQQPSLLFDTYSYLHVLSDPDAGVNGGVYGQGLYSDFEFSLDSISGDKILLTGRFHRSKAILIKATQQEQQAYMSLQRNREFEKQRQFLTYFKRITLGGHQYEITVNLFGHVIKFTWVDGQGHKQEFETGFYYTPSGVAFYPAFTDGNQTIANLDNITWDGALQTIKFAANGANGTITGFAKPLAPDSTAARRWWQAVAGGDYWVGPYGFRVNGVDDAFHVTTLPDYAFMGFWPAYGTSGGVTYDLLGFVTQSGDQQSTLSYGLAFNPLPLVMTERSTSLSWGCWAACRRL